VCGQTQRTPDLGWSWPLAIKPDSLPGQSLAETFRQTAPSHPDGSKSVSQ
jgi:hypothetical protein